MDFAILKSFLDKYFDLINRFINFFLTIIGFFRGYINELSS